MPPKKHTIDDAAGPEEMESKFQFVISTNPSEARSKANKKRVRSVAALKSWPERRKKTFENQDASSQRGGFVLDRSVATPSIVTASKPAVAGPLKRKHSPDPTKPAASRSVSFGSRDSEWTPAEEELFEKCTRTENPDCDCVHCRTERRYRLEPEPEETARHVAPFAAVPAQGRLLKRTADGRRKLPSGDLAMVTPPSSPTPHPLPMVPPNVTLNNIGPAEPFGCYPVPYKPWFDRVLHHMMTVFAPRGWPALKITNTEGRSWERFMTQHALAEPALFYVRLLFASGDLIRLKVLKPEISYWLQTQAIQSLNEALKDPDRAASDAVILAVGRIAFHEFLYGRKEAASAIHRAAQKRMIEMRGGMKKLPFPDLVKRLMRMTDNAMAIQTGTPRMLEDEPEHEDFTMEQHVDAIGKWDPKTGQNLRKTIKISDLLSPTQVKAEPTSSGSSSND